jgi:ERCC4-type nuclease
MVSRLEKYMIKKDKPISIINDAKVKLKEKKLPQEYTIEIDHREQNSNIMILLEEIATEFNIKIHLKRPQLDEGDYRCSYFWDATLEDGETIKVFTYILEELKASTKDAVLSKNGTRLQEQYEKLLNLDNTVLAREDVKNVDIIEIYRGITIIGDWRKLKEENKKDWKGLISWKAKFGMANIPFNKADEDEEFVRYYLKLFYYDFRKTQQHKIIKNIPKNIEIFAGQLMGIPDVGMKTAIEIAKAYPGGYPNLVKASIEDIMKVTAPKSTTPSEIKKNRKTAEKIYYGIRNKKITNNNDQKNSIIIDP